MSDTTSRAWTLLSIDGKRSYGGNDGYDDVPAVEYRFDSGVANGRHIRPGDLAFIRNREGLTGLALIESIRSEPGTKDLLRCPVCQTTGIRERQTRLPLFRCNDGHEFDEPLRETIDVTLYQALYGNTYIPARGAVTGMELRQAAFRTNDQMSIEEVDAGKIADAIVLAAPEARLLLEEFLQRRKPDETGNVSSVPGNGYTPRMADTRKKVLASIRARRGQPKFRRDLIRRYGESCAISGCTVMAIVEAAHIWPYRGEEDNHPENGLLLRADLHTLYDLDLIGIDQDLRVHLSWSLEGSDYEQFAGRQLTLRARPSASAIEHRWRAFSKVVA